MGEADKSQEALAAASQSSDDAAKQTTAEVEAAREDFRAAGTSASSQKSQACIARPSSASTHIYTGREYRSSRACSLAGRAAEERYLDSLPTTTVVHDFGAGRLGIDSFRSDTGRAEVVVVNEGSKVQVGDTILELDGQSVDYDAFHAGLNAARRAKRTVRLLIARGG